MRYAALGLAGGGQSGATLSVAKLPLFPFAWTKYGTQRPIAKCRNVALNAPRAFAVTTFVRALDALTVTVTRSRA